MSQAPVADLGECVQGSFLAWASVYFWGFIMGMPLTNTPTSQLDGGVLQKAGRLRPNLQRIG